MPQVLVPAEFVEKVSYADGQFRIGNFESADKLYSDLLREVEGADEDAAKAIPSLVLKIGESRYAAGAYNQARDAYEKLLAIQEENQDTSSKDRIFTFVKAARNYEKCDDSVNAQAKYEQAYELAKSVLPPKHFLRRTVFECYAQWLRHQKTDPLTLSILESELEDAQTKNSLGQEQPPALETVHPTSTDSKHSSTSERKEPKKNASDFADLKSKLRKRNDQTSSNQTPSNQIPSNQTPSNQTSSSQISSSQISSGQLPSKESSRSLAKDKVDKSVERQVAARKFLNFSVAADGAKTKVDRSKLKHALVEDFAEQKQEIEDKQKVEQVNKDLLAEAEALLANMEEAQKKELEAPAETKEFDLEQSQQSFAEYQAAAAQLDHDQQAERLLAESARLLFNLELVNGNTAEDANSNDDEAADANGDPTESAGLGLKGSRDVAMRRSERSFFGQEEEKKKKAARFSIADFLEKYVPSTDALRKVLVIGVPAVAVVSLVCLLVLSNTNSKPDKLAGAPKYLDRFRGQNLSTADGALTIEFKPENVNVRTDKFRRQPKIYFYQGSTNDELRLMQGTFKNTVWLHPSPEGLASDDGHVFYLAGAPEAKVREVMNEIRTNAIGFFNAARKYPNPEAVQPERFVNPVTKNYDSVNVCSMIVGQERTREADDRMRLDLESGQMFNNEAASKPGAVSVFLVQRSEASPQLGTPASTITTNLYIHGFDRNGALLKTSSGDKVLLYELTPGGSENKNTSTTGKFEQCDFCFVQGETPGVANVAFKYILIAFLLAGGLAFLCFSPKTAPK